MIDMVVWGSEKGTVAEYFRCKFGWKQCSIGNLYRKYVSGGTKIGKEIDFVIKSGRLIKDCFSLFERRK